MLRNINSRPNGSGNAWLSAPATIIVVATPTSAASRRVVVRFLVGRSNSAAQRNTPWAAPTANTTVQKLVT